MSLICWYNKGHFRFLTNAYSPVQQGGHAEGPGGAPGAGPDPWPSCTHRLSALRDLLHQEKL